MSKNALERNFKGLHTMTYEMMITAIIRSFGYQTSNGCIFVGKTKRVGLYGIGKTVNEWVIFKESGPSYRFHLDDVNLIELGMFLIDLKG